MDDKTKAQMELAREYIKSRDYAEARKLLSKINHPKAREWESKLPETKQSGRRKWVIRIGVVIIVFVMIAAGAYAITKIDYHNQIVQLTADSDTAFFQTRTALAENKTATAEASN